MTIIADDMGGYGSSDDDEYDEDSVDEDFVKDDDEDVEDVEDAEEVTRVDDAGIGRIELNWRKGRLASASLGEWARLFTGLEKWHLALSDAQRQFMGPLTKPFHRYRFFFIV
jgi:hypothetical protein